MAAAADTMSREALAGSTPRLRVCVVAPSLDILGGQAVFAARLVARLRSEPGVEVQLLPVNPRLPGPLGVLQRIKYVRTILTSLAYWILLVRRLPACDVVHVFSAAYMSFVLAPLPAMILGRVYRKRVLLNYHSGEAEDHLRRWRWLVVPAVRLAKRVVVPSSFLVDVFARFGIAAVAVPNFVEPSARATRSFRGDVPTLLSNRNLEPHYGIDVVLRAFAIVQRAVPDARLVVVGDGSERHTLTMLARSLRLRHVEFTGRVSPERMPHRYAAADVWLNGSRIDNMPLSILEAFEAGVPVVTTDAGGIPTLVCDGETGLVVPLDDHEAMARAVLRLIADEELARRLVTRARAELDARYTWEAVRARWIALYGARRDEVRVVEEREVLA